ncbi:unnamed protein product [Phaedon cochleariae]|uniref:Endonuclease-reverse transcriptase n=1 Tax=Phaedon cochleariae TaxID=80249 RepID=A0A9N9X4J1_PHACE|nr:unnamed protein product [Phaedon cochleariae]
MGANGQASNNDLLQILRELRDDVKDIKCNLAEQKQHIAELDNKVLVLQSENENLKRQLEFTQQKLKKNNDIIFGIPESINQNLQDEFVHLIQTNLGIPITTNDLNDIYRIGQAKTGQSRPVIVEFVRNFTKQIIIKNSFKLKQVKIIITNDLTPKEREEQKKLYKHLQEAKAKNYNAKISYNKLIVNGERYTLKQLEETAKIEELTDGVRSPQSDIPTRKNNSAPPTPTTSVDIVSEESSEFPHVKEATQKLEKLESNERKTFVNEARNRKPSQGSISTRSTVKLQTPPVRKQ